MRKWLVLFVVVCAQLPLGAGADDDRDSGASSSVVHAVEAGDTLWTISERRYGSRHYSKIIQLYNHIAEPSELHVGDEIKLPDLKAILADEGLTRLMGDEVDSVLAAKARYMDVERKLQDARRGARRGETVEIPEDVREALLGAADELDKAAAGFGVEKPGVVKAPKSLIGQLTQTSGNLRRMATGWSDGYGYDIDMVHQRLALAMRNGIIWARSGFE